MGLMRLMGWGVGRFFPFDLKGLSANI